MVLAEKIERKDITRTIIIDTVLLGVVYYLPTISHLLAFPLYMLDPMRIVIFASILLSKNNINPFILAFTIPLFSYYVGGHPVFFKSILIGVELVENVTLFMVLRRRSVYVFLSVFASILIAKVLYYVNKALFINFGWLNIDLLSTPLLIQLVVTIVISTITTIVFKCCRK